MHGLTIRSPGQRGRLIDPANITASVLNIVANKNYLVPACQSTSIMRRSSSQDNELVVMPGDYTGIIARSSAQEWFWPRRDGNQASRSNNQASPSLLFRAQADIVRIARSRDSEVTHGVVLL